MRNFQVCAAGAAEKIEAFYLTVKKENEMPKVFSKQTTAVQKSMLIFQRIADADRTAVSECLDAYGNMVWALAKKFTGSIEEAETATQEIFLDIWKYADRFDGTETSEEKFIFFVACRCLLKRKPKSLSASAI